MAYLVSRKGAKFCGGEVPLGRGGQTSAQLAAGGRPD